jgi:FAD/FMN-containing dehydrogenase
MDMAVTATAEIKKKLTEIVGDEACSDDAGILEEYASCLSIAPDGKPVLLVKPRNAKQVREIVLQARESGLNLVPVSSGPPRIRGDSLPSGEGIMVDMSSMDKVLRVDRRNKVALIEPGVTFSKLIAEVEKVGLKVMMPLLPQQGKSVLASYLEREPIQIPRYHWDMTDPLLCTELIFGSGDVFRTGSASGPGTLEEQRAKGGAQKNPLGPGQTDMARIIQGSQGTMALVTWASIKLEVKPKIHRLYFVSDDRLSRLVDFSYKALRRRLGDEWFILNSYAFSTVIADGPDELDDLAARQAPYTLVYCVSGLEYSPHKRVAYQEKALAKLAQAAGLEAVPEVPGCSWRRMERILSSPAEDPYYKTVPKGAFLDIFFLTTLDKADSLIEVMYRLCRKYRYSSDQLGIYIQPIQHGRNIHLEFTLYYDPSDEENKSNVEELFMEASRVLDKAGAFFSRPYGIWSDTAFANCPDTVVALRKVKEILDPDNVLNRGKLCFGEGEVR